MGQSSNCKALSGQLVFYISTERVLQCKGMFSEEAHNYSTEDPKCIPAIIINSQD